MSSQELLVVPMPIIDFGQFNKGLSKEEFIYITNIGEEDLIVTKIDLTDETSPSFAIVDLPVHPFNIESYVVYKLGVRYAPTEVGIDRGGLFVGSTDPERPALILPLVGSASEPY